MILGPSGFLRWRRNVGLMLSEEEAARWWMGLHDLTSHSARAPPPPHAYLAIFLLCCNLEAPWGVTGF